MTHFAKPWVLQALQSTALRLSFWLSLGLIAALIEIFHEPRPVGCLTLSEIVSVIEMTRMLDRYCEAAADLLGFFNSS